MELQVDGPPPPIVTKVQLPLIITKVKDFLSDFLDEIEKENKEISCFYGVLCPSDFC